jgi:hypothetical protein
VIVSSAASRLIGEQMKIIEEQMDAVERYIQAIKEAESAGDGSLSLELDLLYCIQEEYRAMLETLGAAAAD